LDAEKRSLATIRPPNRKIIGPRARDSLGGVGDVDSAAMQVRSCGPPTQQRTYQAPRQRLPEQANYPLLQGCRRAPC
jgi:hypothetical protein